MKKINAIHQFLPSLEAGDAIGNYVRELKKYFNRLGYISNIYSQDHDEKSVNECLNFKDYQLHHEDLLVYHHSIGCILTEYVCRLDCRKILIYHNITPPNFFHLYNQEIVHILTKGIKDLADLKSHFSLFISDSEFNARELKRLEYQNLYTLPVLVNYENFDGPNDPSIVQSFKDGHINILHVGRVVPNKKIEDIVKTFYFYNKFINNKSRLFIVGKIMSGIIRYVHEINDLLNYLELKDKVVLTGEVSDDQLRSYYQIADIYLNMSEHEGFCVPLLESIYHGIPVIAFNSSAVKEVLNGEGLPLTRKNYQQVAELIDIVLTDKQLRQDIISGQRNRLNHFSRENFEQKLSHILKFFSEDL